jgi:hypothetical protein
MIIVGISGGLSRGKAHFGTAFTVENAKIGLQSAVFCAEK